MASTRDLILRYQADASEVRKSAAEARKALRGTAAEAEKSGKSFGSKLWGGATNVVKKTMGAAWNVAKTTAKAGGAAVAAVGAAAIGKGFKRLTAIEDATASLKGLGYSAKQAAAIINGPVLKAVQGTAFGLDEAAAAAQGALGAGVKNGKELQKYLTLVGDAATQSGTDFQSMALMMNKVQGSGKLTGDVLQQMAENGLQVMPMLVKALGKPQAEIQKMVSKGKISAKQFQTILQKNIGGAAQKAGDTTTGSFKNMGAALGRVGAKFLNSVFPMFAQAFRGITKLLDRIAPSAEAMGNKVGAAIRGLMSLLGKGDFTKNLKDAFGWEEDSPAVDMLLKVREAFIKTGKAAKVFILGFKGQFIGEDTGLGKWAETLWSAGKKIREVFDGLKQGLGNVDLGAALAVFSPLGTVLKNALPALVETGGALKDIGKALGGALVKILPSIIKAFVSLAATLGGALAEVLPPLVKIVGRLAQTVFPAVAKIIETLLPMLTKIANKGVKVLMDAFKSLTPFLETAAEMVGKFVGFLADHPGLLKTVAKGILIVVGAMKAFRAIMLLVNLAATANPFGLIVTVLGLLVVGLVTAYKKSETFRKIVDGAFNGIKKGAKAFASFFTKTIPAAFRKVVDFIKKNWQKAVFLNPVTAAVALLIKNRDKIVAVFKKLTDWMKGAFKKAWSGVKTVLLLPMTGAQKAITAVWSKIKKAFTAVKTWVGTSWKKGWSKVSGWMADGVGKGRDKIGNLWQSTREKFSNAKTWVSGTWKKGWSKVSGWMSSAVQKGRDQSGTALSGLKDRFAKVKSWLGTTWRSGWSKAKDWITHPIQSARDAIAKIMGNKGVQRIMRAAVSGIGKIWGGLKAAIGKPLNKVIDFINQGLIRGGINKILNALGVPKKEQIPWISPVSFERGGPVLGGNPWQRTGKDRYNARLDHNEHVWTDQEMRRFPGGHRAMFRWRKAVRQGKAYDSPPGFAGGGVVRPVPGGFGSFPSYPGHTGVDFPVGMGTPVHAVMAGMIKSVRALTYSYGKHIIQSLPNGMEALYAHLNSFATKAGASVGAGSVIGYSDSTGNSTGPHLHFTLQHPGGNYVDPTSFLNSGKLPGGTSGGGITGAISDMVGFLKGLSPVKWLTNKANTMRTGIEQLLGKYPWALGLARVPGLIIKKASSYIGDKLFGGIGDTPTGTGSDRWRSTVVSALRLNNLPTSSAYVNAWLKQIQTESGGNAKAVQNGYTDVNTISGDLAKGLLQTISATFNAYKFPGHGDIFNGFDNALAAMNYAKSRYGAKGMLGVIGHGHGYDSGGYLPPGVSLAVNKTGRPEPVLSGRQWDAMAAGQPGITVIVEGDVLDGDQTMRKIVRGLEEYQRRRGGVNLPARSRKLVRGT